MNIIVVGLGKVGEVLVKQLASEKHDVTAIDSDPELETIANQSDVAFIQGNGARVDVLKAAGCSRCDLLIAVTGMDELNILVCSLAKTLGAKETVARVRNPDYSTQTEQIKTGLGIDMCINPEFAATGEILRLLRFPSAMTVDTFTRGSVEIVSYVLKDKSPLDNLPLYDLRKQYPANLLVCAVEREGTVHIPYGNFVLHSGDRISIIATRSEIERFFKSTGTFNKRKIKNVMIIGGSRIGFYLSSELVRYGIGVTLIESNPERCEELSENLPGQVKLLHGDGSNADFLDEHSITDYDALVAITGLDEENMVLAMYASTMPNFNKVIAKVNRQSFLGMVKNTDVVTYVSPKLICTNQILQHVRAKQNSLGSNVVTLHTIVDDKIEALEFKVNEKSRCIGIPLKDLQTKHGLLVACISRKGAIIIPGGFDTIEPGDSVIIVANSRGLKDLDDILK